MGRNMASRAWSNTRILALETGAKAKASLPCYVVVDASSLLADGGEENSRLFLVATRALAFFTARLFVHAAPRPPAPLSTHCLL